jgi:hypothetical protein
MVWDVKCNVMWMPCQYNHFTQLLFLNDFFNKNDMCKKKPIQMGIIMNHDLCKYFLMSCVNLSFDN